MGKFSYSLISSLRYWSWTPDRETIMLAISDKYRDKSKPATNYDSELNRICLPKSVPDCKWDKYWYQGVNDDEDDDDCFAYSKLTDVLYVPDPSDPHVVFSHNDENRNNENDACDVSYSEGDDEETVEEDYKSSTDPTQGTKRTRSLVPAPEAMSENTVSSSTSQTKTTYTPPVIPTSVILSQMPQTEELLNLAHEPLERFKGQIALLRRNGVNTSRNVFIHEDVKEIIPFKLKQTGVDGWELWESWSDEKFFHELLNICTKETATTLHQSQYLKTLNRLSQVDLVIDYRVDDSEISYVSKIKKILRETQFVHSITNDELSSAITKLIKQVGEKAASRENSEILLELQDHLKASRCTSIEMMLDQIGTFIQQRREIWRSATKYNWHPKYWILGSQKRDDSGGDQQKKLIDRGGGGGGQIKRRDDKPPKDPTNTNQPLASPNEGQLCQGCGRKNHTRDVCDRKHHPDYNHTGDWSASDTLRKLKANNVVDKKGNPYTVLPFARRADGSPYTPPVVEKAPVNLGKRKNVNAKHVMTV